MGPAPGKKRQGVRLHSARNIDKDSKGMKINVGLHSESDDTGVSLDKFHCNTHLMM